MSLCAAVGRDSPVLGEDWKSAFVVLFVFSLGCPTAPSWVKRRTHGSSAQGRGSVVEVGLGLVLGLFSWDWFLSHDGKNQYRRAGDLGAKINTGPSVLVFAPPKPQPTPYQNQYRVVRKQPEMLEKCGKVGQARFFERRPLNTFSCPWNKNKGCQNQHRAPKTKVRRVIALDRLGFAKILKTWEKTPICYSRSNFLKKYFKVSKTNTGARKLGLGL